MSTQPDQHGKGPYPYVTERKRRLLELCACEGGATVGYQRAGWSVTAVDLDAAALRRNPANVTVVADALEFLSKYGRLFDAIHASFPCQKWSANGANPAAGDWPDLITPGRLLLNATGKPWVMENVPKAPLRRDLILCGTMFDLTAVDTDGTLLHLDRHRVFESNVPLHLPEGARPVSPHRCGSRPGVQWAGVYGGARKDKIEARTVRKGGYVPPDADVQSALLGGVDWMTGKGRRECIPPDYAEFIGTQLLAVVESEAAA
jgi:DNA (cytosine-5)-methyltransferase 1